jgi:hypothetical protein
MQVTNHLDDNQLSSTAHLAGFGLPYTSSSCIHSYESSNSQQFPEE